MLVALLVALSAPSVQGASAGGKAVPVTNGKIAFVSTRDGNAQIYSINPDGSGLARLTHTMAADLAPAWSPDGTKIAFGCGIGPESGL